MQINPLIGFAHRVCNKWWIIDVETFSKLKLTSLTQGFRGFSRAFIKWYKNDIKNDIKMTYN